MQVYHDVVEHFADFVRLNEAWIVRYFALEEADAALARDPGAVLRAGGHIFTAVVDGNVVGAAALLRCSDDEYELARMAVDPAHQGLGIGRALALVALQKAKALGARQVLLLSNTRLGPALHLYRSLGFRTVSEGPHPLYARCNIVMSRSLAD